MKFLPSFLFIYLFILCTRDQQQQQQQPKQQQQIIKMPRRNKTLFASLFLLAFGFSPQNRKQILFLSRIWRAAFYCVCRKGGGRHGGQKFSVWSVEISNYENHGGSVVNVVWGRSMDFFLQATPWASIPRSPPLLPLPSTLLFLENVICF